MSRSPKRQGFTRSPEPRAYFLSQDPVIHKIRAESKKLRFIHKEIINRSIISKSRLDDPLKFPSLKRGQEPRTEDFSSGDILVNYHPIELSNRHKSRKVLNRMISDLPPHLPIRKNKNRKSLNSFVVLNTFRKKTPTKISPDCQETEPTISLNAKKQERRFSRNTKLKVMTDSGKVLYSF